MQHTAWLQNHSEIDDQVSSDIKEMVKERGNICVSIIVPTHRLGQDRQGDRLEVQRSIFAAKQAMMDKTPHLLSALDRLFRQIDFKRNKEGVGIFVSAHVEKVVVFPFPVTKKIVVNEFFDLHDLLYLENYKSVYYLLDVSKKEIHLFKGLMDHLEEIEDDNLPKQIIEEYEYAKPSPSASGRGFAQLKDVEKDKSILQQTRLRAIFLKADKAVSKYVVSKSTPMMLCGPEKDVSLYKSVTGHRDNIIASFHDNYRGTSIYDLEVFAWLQLRSFLDNKKLELINDLKEKLGSLSLYGLKEVWTPAKEGRGEILLVEKDYIDEAYVTNDNNLELENSDEKFVRHADVVNEIITTVLEKNGRVIILENDAIKDYGRIALMLRY